MRGRLILQCVSQGVMACSLALAAHANEPTSARGYYESGIVHEQNRRYAEAVADFTRAIELDPRFVGAYFSRSGLYDGHPNIRERDYAKAVADLTKVLEIQPRDYSARFNRALDYESLRDYDKAIADYTQVIEGDTDFSRHVESKSKCLAHTYHYRGRAYQWYKEEQAKAAADFTEALRLDPNLEMVHYRRAQAFNSLKEYEKAAADFKVALKRDPNYPNLLCAYAWQLATCPDAKFRDGKLALELAQKANKKFGGAVADHVEALAAAYAENGQLEDAVRSQKKAIELFSTQAKANPELKTAMQARLAEYETGKPFRAE